MRKDAASFVIYRNGSANIADWGRDATLTPDVVSVRQNLDLLVDHGKPVPGLNPNDTTRWGYTLGNAVYVWRSGVGITASGALVYAGGPGLNITTLADILARAGAVRAMELDINTDWVNFAAYDPHGRTHPRLPRTEKTCCPACSAHRTGTSSRGGHVTSSPCPPGRQPAAARPADLAAGPPASAS